jgi:hypothetical protein
VRCLAQLALRLREAAFEISRMFLPHRGRPMPSRLDAEGLKFYATLGSPSMVQVFRFYSITSSARASSDGGISMPSARAVSRLMTNSNLLDCTTGKSAGVAPLRMRPT